MGKFWTELRIERGMHRADLAAGNFKFIKDFGLLNVQGNRKYTFDASPHETGLLIMAGSCEIEIEGKVEKGLGSRDNVFSGKPTAVYVPIDTEFTIKSHKALIGICRGECFEKTEPAIIRSEEIKVMNVGTNNWSREVRTVIGPESPSVNMIVGETINPPGNWSGTPPHKHEGDELHGESLHEELYYFKADKLQGWGIQRLYSPERNINELMYLRDNIVTFIPWGYHQIVAGPGYSLYYLFFLAGKGKELSGYEDPNHNWIKRVDNGGE